MNRVRDHLEIIYRAGSERPLVGGYWEGNRLSSLDVPPLSHAPHVGIK